MHIQNQPVRSKRLNELSQLREEGLQTGVATLQRIDGMPNGLQRYAIQAAYSMLAHPRKLQEASPGG